MVPPNLLLLPGLACDAALWKEQLPELCSVARVSVGDVTQGETLPDIAERVLQRAPRTFALAGFSFGGHVALEIMRQAPERVSRLALLDTSARADTAAQKQRREQMRALATSAGVFQGMSRALMPVYVHTSRVHDRELMRTIQSMAQHVGREVFLRQAAAPRIDGVARLKEIRCPTLVLCGREDVLTPLEYHEEMAAEIPGAQLRVIETCGHMAPLEQPGEVSAALCEWL